MKFIRLQQSTPEWLDWRMKGITASDVSALFGTNPYKTEWKLWAEKSGLQAEDEIEGNPYVRFGKRYEHMLREHIAEERSIGLFPACVEHDTVSILRASLDGIDRYRKPWELKLPSEGNFEEVRKSRKESEPFQRYFYQVQHQMLVTGAAEGFLVFGRIEETKRGLQVVETITEIIPADPRVHQQITEKCREFMLKVEKGVEPAKDPDRDVFAPLSQQDAARWADAVARMKPLMSRKAALEAELKTIKEGISDASQPVIDIMGVNKYGEFSGLRATRVDRQGSIDWPELVKAHGLDPADEKLIGPYRKAGAKKTYQFTAL